MSRLRKPGGYPLGDFGMALGMTFEGVLYSRFKQIPMTTWPKVENSSLIYHSHYSVYMVGIFRRPKFWETFGIGTRHHPRFNLHVYAMSVYVVPYNEFVGHTF